MHIEFVGRHVILNDQIREHAQEKLGRIAKLLGEPVEIHVTLENEKYRQIAEVRVKQRRGELLAREEAPELLTAVNVAVEKIESQARRNRERRSSSRRRPVRAATAVPPADAAESGARGAES